MSISLKILSIEDTCTGCFSCFNSCPVQAISMNEDVDGFYYPQVDFEKCIECKKCDKACPVLNEHPSTDFIRKAYYGWTKKDEIRQKSSSGGMFTMLAQKILDEKGVVMGASFDYSQLRLEHHSTEEVSLDKLRKSKYVQSYVGDSFRHVKRHLDTGRKVLFVGTPCQVAGLKSFLGTENENLLTCDFICHGVPPMKLLRMHLNYLKIDRTKISEIDFRPKITAWVDDLVVSSQGKIVYRKPWAYDPYFFCFQKYMSLRKSCYNCSYCGEIRNSDLTLADFWGIHTFNPALFDKRGISLMISNTQIGDHFIDERRKDPCNEIAILDFKYAQYVYKKRGEGSAYNLDKRNAFFLLIQSTGYVNALRTLGLKSREIEFDYLVLRLKNFTKRILSIQNV